MPFQPIIYTGALALNASNDTSPSSFTDLRTGQPVLAGGLNLGDYFDLTNKEAYQLSYLTQGTLYNGRYRRILVDSGATAANVKTGTIGVMPSLAAQSIDFGGTAPATSPSVNVVTSYDQGIGSGSAIRPVVFLNSITPGNYGFIQELGVATLLGKSTLTNATPAVQDVIISATGGVADDPTQSTTLTYALLKLLIGKAIDLPVAGGKFRVTLDYLPTLQE